MSINIEAVARHWQLSPPEVEVLGMLLAGQGNNAIARSIGRSVKTVEAHVTRILRKAECSNRLMLMVRAAAVSSQDEAVGAASPGQARPGQARLSRESGVIDALGHLEVSSEPGQDSKDPRDRPWAKKDEEPSSETRVQAVPPSGADQKSMLETG